MTKREKSAWFCRETDACHNAPPQPMKDKNSHMKCRKCDKYMYKFCYTCERYIKRGDHKRENNICTFNGCGIVIEEHFNAAHEFVECVPAFLKADDIAIDDETINWLDSLLNHNEPTLDSVESLQPTTVSIPAPTVAPAPSEDPQNKKRKIEQPANASTTVSEDSSIVYAFLRRNKVSSGVVTDQIVHDALKGPKGSLDIIKSASTTKSTNYARLNLNEFATSFHLKIDWDVDADIFTMTLVQPNIFCKETIPVRLNGQDVPLGEKCKLQVGDVITILWPHYEKIAGRITSTVAHETYEIIVTNFLY
jgi:hypothetical protein